MFQSDGNRHPDNPYPYLDKRGRLQSIEGLLKDICLKLGIREAAHVQLYGHERRMQLLKLVISVLQDIDLSADAAMSLESASRGGDPDEEAAISAMLRGMTHK